MQTAQEASVMDFGPNLFGGGSSDLASSVSTEDIDTTIAGLADAAAGSDQSEEKAGVSTGDNASSSEGSAVQQGNPRGPEQSATQVADGSVGVQALSSAKAAVKVFHSITGFDEQSANQRTVIRNLMLKHSQAMELKLQGKKPPEGEDFDAIAKQLRRENTRLDSLLEGKESLFGKARKAAEIAIEQMQSVIAEIDRMEEEG